MPSGPILITLRVIIGSSGVPDPVICVLSESVEPISMSASASPMPLFSFSSSSLSSSSSSPSESLPPPNKSLKLMILLMIPSADFLGFLGSSFFGNGMPSTALASSPVSDGGIDGNPTGRLDVPSPFIRRRIIGGTTFLFLVPDNDLFSLSSYKMTPGSAFIAALAAAVSGCQLAWR